jgi:hypothetical protein
VKLLVVALAALVLSGPAAAADRQVLFGDGFQLETADPGPFDRLADGRLACLSDACAGKTVVVAGVTVQVLPRVTAKQVAAVKPPYQAPTTRPATGGSGAPSRLLFAGAALLVLLAAALVASESRRRRGDAPVDRLRRALRLVRESATRAPGDRRRALDNLAVTLDEAPPAERATRLAWARTEPEPAATLGIADEVAR